MQIFWNDIKDDERGDNGYDLLRSGMYAELAISLPLEFLYECAFE